MNRPVSSDSASDGASGGVPADDDMAILQYRPWAESSLCQETLSQTNEVFYDTPEAADRLSLPHKRKVSEAAFQRVHDLPAGLYFFESRRSGGRTAALALYDGSAPVPTQRKRLRDVEDSHLLHRALLLYRACRTQLEMPKPEVSSVEPIHAVGDVVRVTGRGSAYTVVRARAVGGKVVQYTLRGVDGRSIKVFEEDLEAVAAVCDDPEQWILGSPASAAETALTLTLAKLSTPLTDTVYSFQSSRTVFRPYQFRPVLKLMNSDRQRLLIADEVGLGKTIEAGLIWNELEQRTHLTRRAARRAGTHFRGLVICPAALVQKWQDEMEQRFDRRLRLLDNNGMEELLKTLRRGDDEEPFAGVISLERLRRVGQLDELIELQPRFDLVIVDEAHYVRNAQTSSHAAVSRLADWADALIFLSATPLNLGNQDLYNLVHLLDPGSFPDPRVFEAQLEPNRHLNTVAARLAGGAGSAPGGANGLLPALDRVPGSTFGRLVAQRPEFTRLRRILTTSTPLSAHQLSEIRRCIADLNALAGIVSRTRKAGTPDAKAVRVPEDVKVTWTAAERDFYDQLHDWCLRRAARSGTASAFAAQMWLRQAASCIPAMQQRLRERFSGTPAGPGTREAPTNRPGFLDEETALLDDAEAEVAPEAVKQAADQDGEELAVLPALLRPLAQDTKFEAFVGMLREAQAKGLRQAMVFSFFKRTLEYLKERLGNEFRVRVMHGGVPPQERTAIMADFRAVKFDLLLVSEVGSEGLDFEFCNVLVNYDLPWNPMRVEQRIGRLDRFGQKHEKIFIFNMQVPGTIETDIFQRLYQRIGVFQDSIGELEPILHGQLRELHRVVLNPHLTQKERQRQIDRIDVARVDRDKDIASLEKAREYLTGLDDLLVEGFDQHTPGRGRYLGPREIRGLLDAFLHQSGVGRMDPVPSADDLMDITGSGLLRQIMYEAQDAGVFSLSRGSDLMASLADRRRSLRACFTAQTSTETGAPLLSVRHPLVRTAHWWFAERTESTSRYGRVRVPGLPPGSRYLVEVRLAQVDGARPRRELWTTAVDTETLQEVPGVGTALLTCLADGGLGGATEPLPARISKLLPDVLDTVQDLAAEREFSAKQTYQAENVALAAGRRATVEDTYRHKIEQARRLAQEVDSTSIRRLHAARVGLLKGQRDARLAQMDRDSRFSLSTETVALVVVEG
ncbi:helicase-related protein [Streptomyces sp. NPDC058682]|uniref:helicase-related protein n=1 Tax=Streptomyces sp. NPDC058682 TaxID=3346596 RepID=UPI00364E61A9